MKLPNPENAIVDLDKLLNYCLNPGHWRGRHKARLFASVLGITQNNPEPLRDALLGAARFGDAIRARTDEFGQRYMIDFELANSFGKAIVRSGWIVLAKEDFPRLVTCFVLRRVKRHGT